LLSGEIERAPEKKRQQQEKAIKIFCKVSPNRTFNAGREARDREKIGGVTLAERAWELPEADQSLLNKNPLTEHSDDY